MRVNEENKNEKNEKQKQKMLDFNVFFKKKFDPLISKKMVPGQDIPTNEKIRKKNKNIFKKQHIKKKLPGI